MHPTTRPATATAFVQEDTAVVIVEMPRRVVDLTISEVRAFIRELQAAADDLEVNMPIDLMPA